MTKLDAAQFKMLAQQISKDMAEEIKENYGKEDGKYNEADVCDFLLKRVALIEAQRIKDAELFHIHSRSTQLLIKTVLRFDDNFVKVNEFMKGTTETFKSMMNTVHALDNKVDAVLGFVRTLGGLIK